MYSVGIGETCFMVGIATKKEPNPLLTILQDIPKGQNKKH